MEDLPDQQLSTLQMPDPRIAPQLVRGVYGVEQGAWRWTAAAFGFKLKTPAGAAQKGAALSFRFSIPDVVLSRLGPLTLACSVNGAPLPPETYSSAGDHVYARDVAAAALVQDPAAVEFKLDKSLPPTDQDGRELGVVASLVGLQAKP